MNARLRPPFLGLAFALALLMSLVVSAAARPPQSVASLRRIDDADAGSDSAQESAPAARTLRKDDRVSVMGSAVVAADETIEGNAVAVMGDLTVKGEVAHDAVAVMGDNHVDGTVHGEVVAVMGNVYLGPHAVVDRDVTCVVGEVIRDPGAKVRGSITHQMGGGVPHHLGLGLSSWWTNGLSVGRVLPLVHETRPLWLLTLGLLAVCILVTAVFPRGVQLCGDALVQRPGATVATGLLTILGLPFLFVLLLVTVVGIPVALVLLPLGLFIATLFGSAGILVLIGRGLFGNKVPPAVGVAVAGIIVVVLYATPVIGVPVHLLLTFLGLSCAVAGLLGLKKASVSVSSTAPAATAEAPGEGKRSVAVTLQVGSEPEVAAAPQAVPPTLEPTPPPAPIPAVPAASLPRAGFWIRMAALLIDAILIGIVFSPIGGGHFYFVLLAAYGAILWKTRGSTVGGIIFKLRVVRTDDRPVDWPTAIVRALGCFISLVIAGLGFIWIAFDADKQSWHDKISGTVVVREAKATPLV